MRAVLIVLYACCYLTIVASRSSGQLDKDQVCGNDCNDLQLNDEKIVELLKSEKILSYETNIQFNYCNISSVASNFFRLFPNIREAEFKSGYLNLKKLETNETFEENKLLLEKLTLTDTKVMPSSLYNNTLEGFSNLKNLSIRSMYKRPIIWGIDNGAFAHTPNLIHLELSYQRLTTISKYTLEGLENLENLILSYCELSSIDNGAFIHTPNLKKLDLSNNELTRLSQFALQGLENLEYLDLSSNDITSIDDGAFKHTPKLKHIFILLRNFKTITINTFKNLPYLETLKCKMCSIEVIEDGAFASLISLEFLDLGSNNLGKIYTNTFRNLTKLRKLDLSLSSISTIDDGAFQDLINLEKLELYLNKLTHITNTTFVGLQSLIHLDLNRNPIKRFDGGAFAGTPNLRFLDLRKTKAGIVSKNDKIFESLSHPTSIWVNTPEDSSEEYND